MHYMKALDVLKTFKNRDEKHNYLKSDLCLHIAASLVGQREFSKAQEYCNRAEEAAKLIDDQEHDLEVSATCHNIANAYVRQANEALVMFHKAVDIYILAFGDNHPDLATIYDNMAKIYRDKNNIEEAERLD
ncbi:uncharacterized protein TRIADDRAFT_54876 [Trichoplax adhaerens]|uniref:Kinesin light chain n=1 Tax=Trichoplax adhaerens TaxID=10228 RepID=B3RT87_TRIAD|nr:predicted protein [Trichoplax adhaerens]EDV27181.1 predicted protein [Trichoplax adhaerens]|eukprot:XP_002111177.1 predicted protein [Trichoplax adhaerens]